MATPLLTTKLYIPSLRREMVPRPHLVERLSAGLKCKLTLISAPAGFGKTTLLSEWSRSCGRPVAWVSLDTGDNDPARFWAYWIAALQRICPGLGATALAALQSRQPPPSDALLTALLNEIVEVPDPLALVLDDFHLVTAQPIQEALLFFLENIPPQMHLLVAGRADPPWPLARLRTRREMAELRAPDLRFSPAEAAVFLNDVMGLGLSVEDIDALEARTEGWIVGLHMAALSMRGRSDVPAFIEAFRGSHRFVLDYLVEEVLDGQPEPVQAFLLQTSILERMTASLCDAVLGIGSGETGDWQLGIERPPHLQPALVSAPGSQAILEHLERDNLFLVPLDDERRWYRYYHLFADLLRSRLRQTQPDRMNALCRRASAWYAQQGLVSEAVSYALEAGDIDRVVRLVEENALPMIYHGQLTTLVGWLEALPVEVVRSWPWLSIAYAWALAYSGQWDGIESLLRDVEEALQHTPATAAGLVRRYARGHITGQIAAIRAYRAMLRGDFSPAADLAREALEALPEEDRATRGFIALLRGSVIGMSGDLAAAVPMLSEAARVCQAADDTILTIMVLTELASFQVGQGQLHRAAATCRQALQLADEHARQIGRRPPVVAFAYSRLSSVLCEWNDLEAAVGCAQEAVELSRMWGQRDSLYIGCIHLAQALLARGDIAGALHAVQEAQQVGGDLSPWYATRAAALAARLHLAQGDLAAAIRWVQEHGLSVADEISFQGGYQYHTLARILMAQERWDEALQLLARLQQVARTAGAMGALIDTLVLQAVAYQARGQVDQALAALEQALLLAAPEGFVRVFIDQGAPMGQLLRQAAGRGIALDYVSKLLAALESQPKDMARAKVPPPSPARRPLPALVEALSPREFEVLRLLVAGLSNKDIAQRLVISVGTVKNHLKSIYGKLEVGSRTRAAARARELGLL